MEETRRGGARGGAEGDDDAAAAADGKFRRDTASAGASSILLGTSPIPRAAFVFFLLQVGRPRRPACYRLTTNGLAAGRLWVNWANWTSSVSRAVCAGAAWASLEALGRWDNACRLARRDVACLDGRYLRERQTGRPRTDGTSTKEAGLGLDDLDRGSEIQGGALAGGDTRHSD